ncbi:hypothetical protein BGX27_002364 [Mortierella sp. AM989]|nr:hypothetical protein BGX27_002364 [Mortierella sp. AM989]
MAPPKYCDFRDSLPGKELDPPQDYDDNLLDRVHQISDPDLLKQLLIQKEQERQGLASNLDLAARLGLDLHQQIQRLELESTIQIQSLQDENHALQQKASLSQELQYQLSSSEHEVKELTGHNRFLQRELDACRQELKSFRKELDELSEHMTEISSEMFDAKSKVNSYARRLGEVEQELASTQELNVNLQLQLNTALQKQKQTHSSTSQAVKLIQSDLGKVFSDSDTMRMTLEELETRQIKCEGKVVEMMTNTREYAQLLEEAQETIHALRIESDMEGRGWSSHGPHAAIWDDKTGEHPEQHLQDIGTSNSQASHHIRMVIGTTVHEDSSELEQAEELDPMFDTTGWGSSDVNSLGMELGLGSLNEELAGAPRSLGQELSGFGQEIAENYSGMHGTLADELGAVENRPPFINMHEHVVSTFASDNTDNTLGNSSFDIGGDDDEVHVLPQRFSLSAELHQRLEENNILQNVLSSRPTWSTTTTTIGITSVQHSSNSIRDIGRTLSMMTLANQRASTSTSTLNVMMSPKAPSQSPAFASTSESTASASMSVAGFVPSGPNMNSTQGVNTDIANTSYSSLISSPGTRRAAMDAQNILGLKYLLSAASSSDLSNVITKTNAKSPASVSPNISSKDAKSRSVNVTGNSVRSTTPGSTGKNTTKSSTSTPKRTMSIPNDRMTSSKPIPIVGAADGRSGRKQASPASSWSNPPSAIPVPTMTRRPSLPPISSSPSTPTGSSSNKPRPPWN